MPSRRARSPHQPAAARVLPVPASAPPRPSLLARSGTFIVGQRDGRAQRAKGPERRRHPALPRRALSTQAGGAYARTLASAGRDRGPLMKTVDDLEVSGQRVLVRADLNVPLDGTCITDDGKIRACLPTLSALLDRGAAVMVCSHLGRPAGTPDPGYTLAPVAARLGELLGRTVVLTADTVGPAARTAVAGL